jgi:hypothetical protein
MGSRGITLSNSTLWGISVPFLDTLAAHF